MNPILAQSYDWAPGVIAWVGVITALFAATIAVAQNDIKKVLAYSTVSQLGYMFLAVGSGAYVAAIFHMITHAFFKALLFLGSGSVIHGMHDEQDMRRMGGLRKVMPITAGTFIVGLARHRRRAALRRLLVEGRDPAVRLRQEPGPVDRRSRDRAAHRVLHEPPAVHGLLRRAEWRATAAASQPDAPSTGTAGASPHESPWLMTFPLVVLAGLAIVGGLLNLPAHDRPALPRALARTGRRGQRAGARRRPPPARSRWPSSPPSPRSPASSWPSASTSRSGCSPSSRRSSPRAGTTTARSPRSWAARVSRRSRRVATFDREIVDGAVDGRRRRRARRRQGPPRASRSGFVRSYALGVAVGAVALLVYFLTRAGI